MNSNEPMEAWNYSRTFESEEEIYIEYRLHEGSNSLKCHITSKVIYDYFVSMVDNDAPAIAATVDDVNGSYTKSLRRIFDTSPFKQLHG